MKKLFLPLLVTVCFASTDQHNAQGDSSVTVRPASSGITFVKNAKPGAWDTVVAALPKPQAVHQVTPKELLEQAQDRVDDAQKKFDLANRNVGHWQYKVTCSQKGIDSVRGTIPEQYITTLRKNKAGLKAARAELQLPQTELQAAKAERNRLQDAMTPKRILKRPE